MRTTTYPSQLSVASNHWDVIRRTTHTNHRSHTNCSVVPLESFAFSWVVEIQGEEESQIGSQTLSCDKLAVTWLEGCVATFVFLDVSRRL